MKKTNILIEVSDDLYKDIVEPAKKSKTFSKLVVKLLEAYRENDSIYSYINGSLDGLREEENEELLKSLSNMANSISMLDALSSQAESMVDEGVRTFNEYSTEVKEPSIEGVLPLASVVEENKNSNSLTREEVEEIVVNTVSKSLSGIEDMLKQLMENSSTVIREVKVSEEEVSTKVKQPLGDTIVEKEIDLFEDEEIDEESAKEAEDALSSLLGSLSY